MSYKVDLTGLERDGDVSLTRQLADRFSGAIESGLLEPGEKLILRFGGGAGYGDPSERDPERVKADLKNGYITPEAAERDYNGQG